MGQRGQLERIPLAHTGTVMSLDWLGCKAHIGGWLASAGLDRIIKVAFSLLSLLTWRHTIILSPVWFRLIDRYGKSVNLKFRRLASLHMSCILPFRFERQSGVLVIAPS